MRSIRYLYLAACVCAFTFSCGNPGLDTRKSWSSIAEESIRKPGLVSNSLNPDLEDLELVMVDLTLEDFEYVSSLKHLRSLTIGQLPEGECIANLDVLALLGKLNKLEYLSLAIHGLTSEHLGFVSELSSLKVLRITSPLGTELNLSEQFVRDIARLENLESLEIWDKGVQAESLQHLRDARKLIEITVKN